MVLDGTASAGVAADGALACLDWSMALIARPMPNTARRRAPAASMNMTMSQPSRPVGGAPLGRVPGSGRGSAVGRSPLAGAVVGSVMTLIGPYSALVPCAGRDQRQVPRGTLVPISRG